MLRAQPAAGRAGGIAHASAWRLRAAGRWAGSMRSARCWRWPMRWTGVDLNDLHVYVGVSSGSLIAAGLANGLSPAELYRDLHRECLRRASDHAGCVPDGRPSASTTGGRWRLPGLLLGSLWEYLQHPLERGLWGSMLRPGAAHSCRGVRQRADRALPDPDVHQRRSDQRFPQAAAPALYVVATDLDSGESVEFGAKGYDDVPIAKAVQASTALAGAVSAYPHRRARLRRRGAEEDTCMHRSPCAKAPAWCCASIRWCPSTRVWRGSTARPKHDKLVEGGLPVVLSQTFRALIHSRMQVGMAKYEKAYKGADVLLFEPNADDAEMFFANVFSYANRRRVCDHAYQQTLREIARRRTGARLRSWRATASGCVPRFSTRTIPTSRPARRYGWCRVEG